MEAPYSYPPPPPSSGGGYYPPASSPSSGGYYAPPPSGGYNAPPPSYSGAPVMSPGGIPPPTGNFGGTPAQSMDLKARWERQAQKMVYLDIVVSSVSLLMWIICMAVFKWVYLLPYSLEILLPGGLVFLIPLVLDILIVAKKWLKNERMIIYWISGISLKIVSEVVLIILFCVFAASEVLMSGPNTGTPPTRRRRNSPIQEWIYALIFTVMLDFGLSSTELIMMVCHLCFLRKPNPTNGGPGGASQPFHPPPGIMG